MSGDGARVAYPLFQREDGGSHPTSPLQFDIREITIGLALELNFRWHSRLPKITNPQSGHSVYYGALYEGRWYACAIWSDPIARMFNNRNYLELRRMAICDEAPKNTASRMLAIMERKICKKWPNLVKLISYQDTEVHTGTIYRAAGWKIAIKSAGGSNSVSSKQSWCWKRKRVESQATGYKIRWEKDLK